MCAAPQGSLLPLLPPAGAGCPPAAPHGSPAGLAPADGGEPEPANTSGEPRLGGTEAPKHIITPHKENLQIFGVTEQEAMAAIDEVIHELANEDEKRKN